MSLERRIAIGNFWRGRPRPHPPTCKHCLGGRITSLEARKKISEAIARDWQKPGRLAKNLIKWTPQAREEARLRLEGLIKQGKVTRMRSSTGWDKNSYSWLERKFLKILSDMKLHGFRHNFEIDAYDMQRNEIRTFYADYCYPELKLVIECDSKMYHTERWQKVRDATRQEILEQEGYTVIRFSSDQILKQQDMVKATLKKAVEEAAKNVAVTFEEKEPAEAP